MQTVQLQGVGKVKAKPASEFSVGDFMGWNFGHCSLVVGVAKETKSFITYELQNPETGDIHERRLGKSRLVAIG